MPKVKLTNRAAALNAALYTYLRPRIAADKQIDLSPVLLALRKDKLSDQRPVITTNVTKAVDGKLAQDADIEDLGNLLDAVAAVVDEPSASIPDGMEQNDDPDLELADVDNDGREELVNNDDAPDPMVAKIREFLKQCGMSDEMLAQFDQLVSSEGEPEDLDNDGDVDDYKDDDMNRDRRPRLGRDSDKPGGAPMPKPAVHTAMDKAAVEKQIETRAAALAQDAVLKERQNQRAIAAAEKKVRPVVGDLAIAFDSAPDVFGQALKILGHEARLKNTPKEAWESMFDMAAQAAKAAARPATRIAADAASGAGKVKSIADIAPGANRVSFG